MRFAGQILGRYLTRSTVKGIYYIYNDQGVIEFSEEQILELTKDLVSHIINKITQEVDKK